FRTKAGRIAHILKNTAGPKELWALSSTQGDTALRDYLYDELDGPTARAILAENFEHGSAQRVIEFRRKKAGEQDAGTSPAISPGKLSKNAVTASEG
ncbi:hypothetical protein CKF46_27850, partial [Klebsiella pneumoniae]